MCLRALMVVPALVMTALALASSADAVTLYTDFSHTTRVTVGATARFTAAANFEPQFPGTVTSTSGGTVSNTCSGSTLTFKLTQNTATRVEGAFVAGTFGSCTIPITPTFPWNLTLTGGSVTTAPVVIWTNATLTGFRYDSLGSFGSGTLAPATGIPSTLTGLSVQQVGPRFDLPICLIATHARTVLDSALGEQTLDARWCITGHPQSTWFLT